MRRRRCAPAASPPISPFAASDLYASAPVEYSGSVITQKAKYAFKALLFLAAQPAGTSLSIEAVAKGADVPRKFLEHILLDLKKSGLVASRRGIAVHVPPGHGAGPSCGGRVDVMELRAASRGRGLRRR